ncbi:hypothetical protein [Oerskovia flava]|uniref:hypothetical protein n=1 Tax=Oerskovia flava TaxID=2986422 RepID=UPI00223F78D3|nr:hypothetical protein [Oerskovia sp. JB1-3-2]
MSRLPPRASDRWILGAALGIGAGFDVSLEWSPADTVLAISDVDGITGGWW